MPESLDIAQLRTLVAVAECGGMSRAAAVLHISQPTVSQHVRTLERKLQRPLVEKAGRRVRFTPDGERLLVQARRILDVHDDALSSLDVIDAPPVVVGLADSIAGPIIGALGSDAATGLPAAFGGRAVRYVVDREHAIADAVERGSVDVALLVAVGGGLRGRQAGVLRLDWYGDAPLDAGAPVPLVTAPEPSSLRQRTLQQLGAYGYAAEIVVESAGIEGIVAAVRAGVGVAALPTLPGALGARLADLPRRVELPSLGSVNLRVVGRAGAGAELEDAAGRVFSDLFASHSGAGAR